ncbi:MAG: hypothetical protein A2X59_09365 [Nitrospirae bacterium GWC2_42_7]|nr:MAG: hypothetical protein A2X59_09365 [Nitrospirae bacterium GWC2_42_7]
MKQTCYKSTQKRMKISPNPSFPKRGIPPFEITPPPSAPPLKIRGGRGCYDSGGRSGEILI